MPWHYFLSYQQQLGMDDTHCQERKAKTHLHNEMGVGYLWKNDLATPADIHFKLGKASFWTRPEEKIIRSKNVATKMMVATQLENSKNWNQLKCAIGYVNHSTSAKEYDTIPEKVKCVWVSFPESLPPFHSASSTHIQ